jgi:hypothetical protein
MELAPADRGGVRDLPRPDPARQWIAKRSGGDISNHGREWTSEYLARVKSQECA